MRLIASDIGYDEIEEVNIVEAGRNYGWDSFEGTLPEQPTPVDGNGALTPPAAEYDHHLPSNQIDVDPLPADAFTAIVGGHVYRGSRSASLQGQYLFGDIPRGRFFTVALDDLAAAFESGTQASISELLVFDDDAETTFMDLIGATRGDARFGRDNSGELFITNKTDRVVRRLVVDAPATDTDADVVDIEFGANDAGHWIAHADGTVVARDGARFHGHRPPLATGERVTSMARSSNGAGYLLFSDRGNAFAYGDADHHGDVGHLALDGPVIAGAMVPDGTGYYLLADDGGVFTLGSASFHGSVPQVLPGVTLDAPVVGMAASPAGYVLVAGDGGAFTFGDAGFFGSIPELLPGVELDAPIVGLVGGPAGYLMLGADGGVFNFGDSPFHGSLGGVDAGTIVAVAARADLAGYTMVNTATDTFSFP